ncbi:MAG: hypothetical protein LBF97_03490, partial [Elusimicrobiota bacterium]|nr:hypothetical protein [Elusimicrobiota bacterium]
MADKILSELPLLQYSGIDYNTVVQEMIRIIEDNPKWKDKWSSFYSGEAGTLLTEFVAFIADNLAIKIDSMVNEFFVSTASRDIDRIRLLKLINYIPKYATAAELYATIETSSMTSQTLILTPENSLNTPLRNRVNSITAVYGNNGFGQKCRFEFLLTRDSDKKPEYLSGVFLPKNNNSV